MEENMDKEDMEETNSTGSEESKKDTSGKWREFRFRNAKKVPKLLLHSLVVPSPLNPNPPKQFMNPPPSPELVADKQDPNRFFGDGVNFKAKLIGIKEVGQARGDRLAQEALLELKGNVKASNTHKQKIVINVSVEGIKIKDEKGLNVLHHHPVHKISFIAQDIADNRAFGYVFGSPALGHSFFAIKTEKAAQQVVVAMRDLFQVVFNLRKREIEENISCNTQANDSELQHNISDVNEDLVEREVIRGNGISAGNEQEPLYIIEDSPDKGADKGPDLLDLDAELEEKIEGPRKSIVGEEDFFANPASNDPFFTDPLMFISSISSSMSSNTEGSFLTVNVTSTPGFAFDNTPTSEEVSTAFNVHFDGPSSTPATTLVTQTLTTPITNPFESSDKYAPITDYNRASLTDLRLDSSHNIQRILNTAFIASPDTSNTEVDSTDLPTDVPKTDPDFFRILTRWAKTKVLNDLVHASSQRSSSPPSSDSNFSVASSQSVGSPPLSVSPSPNPFACGLREPSSSGTSSPLANSDGGSSDSYISKCNGRNLFFDDEFNLPSPANPPPPLPPVVPPRPVSAFAPPLPPKKPTPMFKLDPPVSLRDNQSLKHDRSAGERPGGTLPIPIPSRRVRGPVPGLGSSPRPVSGRYANTPESNYSLTSVSSMSQQSDRSKGSSISSEKNVCWSSPNGSSYSPRCLNIAVSSPGFPLPPPLSLNNGLDNKCFTVNNNVEQVDNMVTRNRGNVTDFETAWIMAKPIEQSIFHRNSDPFADDFFTSSSNEEARIESYNKINSNGLNVVMFLMAANKNVWKESRIKNCPLLKNPLPEDENDTSVARYINKKFQNKDFSKKLKTVILSCNDIDSIADIILPSTIEILELGYNRFTTVNEIYYRKLIQLRYLGLAYNLLKTIVPAERSLQRFFPNLFHLDLSHNELDSLVNVISLVKTIASLRILLLHGNPCSFVNGYRGFVVVNIQQLMNLDEVPVYRKETQLYGNWLMKGGKFEVIAAGIMINVISLSLPPNTELTSGAVTKKRGSSKDGSFYRIEYSWEMIEQILSLPEDPATSIENSDTTTNKDKSQINLSSHSTAQKPWANPIEFNDQFVINAKNSNTLKRFLMTSLCVYILDDVKGVRGEFLVPLFDLIDKQEIHLNWNFKEEIEEINVHDPDCARCAKGNTIHDQHPNEINLHMVIALHRQTYD
uniref:PID domain-containing protein n=1 Tax=Strigamia maritima TaxID=126957 RepID=T1ITD6_STRMM